MTNQFFAMMSRMKYIERWALMRNSRSENISEHCLEVGMIAHGLAVISNVRLQMSVDEKEAALMGMFHDSTEIITGDMPTPIKYYNDTIREAFQAVEEVAAGQLLDMLPQDMRSSYEALFFPQEDDQYLWKLVKAADKLSALIKCIEERKAGNHEFIKAEQTLRQFIEDMNLEAVEIFVKEFLPAYDKTLDELH